ncbi:MAG: helix-hairpin-helix domain-containing protein [Chloroherpetonaceae bacterium]|nr:helix-hairpin-helix domain-containing protein [Chloroherpetonaceae bacterium]
MQHWIYAVSARVTGACALLLLVCVCTMRLFAQSGNIPADSIETLRRQTLDRLLDLSEEQSGNSELLEQFNWLRRQKVNLNTAGLAKLLSMPFLTALDVERILAYRRTHGGFKAVAELRALIDEDTYELIRDFLTVGRIRPDQLEEPSFLDDLRRGVLWQRASLEYIGRSLFETPNRVGFQNGAYQGSPPRLYSRIQGFLSDNFMVSVLAEKDVGEVSLSDFASATLLVRDLYALKTLVIGDYNLSFGQGLAIQSGRAFFKSPEAVASVKQSLRQVRPYTSTSEQNYFRGVAAEIELGILTVIGFYSRNKISGTTNDTAFSSLNLDGIFRTESQIARKHNIDEQVFGARAQLNTELLENLISIGASFYQTRYDRPFIPQDELFNRMRFRGEQSNVISLDWDYLFYQFNVFGEAAYSVEQRSLSWMLGVQTEFAKGVKGVIHVRNYAPAYYSSRANAFSETSGGAQGRNERGIYLGAELRVLPDLKLRAYYDYYQFPFIASNTVLPSAGNDMLLQVSYKPRRDILIETLLQAKTREEALTQVDASGREYRIATPQRAERIRTDFVYELSPQVRLRTRVEVKHFTQELVEGTRRNLGWLIAQDINLDLFDQRLSIDARLAFFQTDSFDAAIYAFENDLPLTFTVYAHNGRGQRAFVNLRYQILAQVELAARFANVFRDDVASIGSGNEAFPSNTLNTLSLGLRVRF